MGIRTIHIDEHLGTDAENMAEALGYDGLDHYVTTLIERDLNEKAEMAAIAREANIVSEDNEE